MRTNDIPVKTEAGNREIGKRAHKLSPRSRSLLIVIHGAQSVGELAQSFRGLGDITAILTELAGLGLIAVRDSGQKTPVTSPTVQAANAPDLAPPAQQAKQLLNESAVAVLGLRAFLFTLKLEHCYTADELRGIIPEYRRVVSKSKGADFAEAIIARVDSILARP